METLIINVPKSKSALVKAILKELGVTIQETEKTGRISFKESLANMSVWTDEDIKPIKERK
jgi:hypothetical protein